MNRNILAALCIVGVLANQPARAEGLPSFTSEFNLAQLKAAAASVPGEQAKEVPRSQETFAAETGVEHIYLNPTYNYAAMDKCGGTVQFKVAYGRGNIIFRGVENCSNFDIQNANGWLVKYPNKKLDGEGRDRFGSFTLPRDVIDWGVNEVVVVLQSNSKKTQTKIHLMFLGL